jgi:hypothetical protein
MDPGVGVDWLHLVLLVDPLRGECCTLSNVISVDLLGALSLLQVGATDWSSQWVWASSSFFLIGGGPTVGTTLLTTMVADVVPAEQRLVACP